MPGFGLFGLFGPIEGRLLDQLELAGPTELAAPVEAFGPVAGRVAAWWSLLNPLKLSGPLKLARPVIGLLAWSDGSGLDVRKVFILSPLCGEPPWGSSSRVESPVPGI